MGLLRKLAGQTAVYGLSSIAGRVINWGLTPVHTALFATATYGLYSDLLALTFTAQVFLTFGMETSFFHYSSKDRSRADEAYGQAFAWVLLLTALFAGLGWLVHTRLAEVLGYGDRPLLVLMAMGIVAMDALAALPMARLRYREKALRFASINLVNIGLTVALNLILLLGVEADVAYVFLANLVASALRVVLALLGNLPTHLRPRRHLLLPMRRYGFFIMLAGLAGAQNEVLDRNLLPRLWPAGQAFLGIPHTGLEMAGIYSAVYKLAVFIALGTQAFRYAAEPFFFRDAKEKDSRQNLRRIFHWFMIASLGTMLLVGSFAYELVSFDAWGLLPVTLVDSRYWSGLRVVPLLLAANVCMGAYINLAIWYKITGQLRMGLYIALAGLIVTVGVNVLTIPHWGYVGSAVATLLCYLLMTVLCWRLGERHYPVGYRMGRILAYGLLCLGVASLHLSLFFYGYVGSGVVLLKLLGCALVFAIIYAVERRWPLPVERT